ncbi:PREDICTED: myogenin [Myotis davidii]|uniref:myogenin n=1 Tax=Myotis davidii TaxID=225400 RepID=UPI000766E787|nr:PREDICTED: myogenin [Myotis davidii]
MAPSSWREGLQELGGQWQERASSDPMELYETPPYFYQEPHFYDGENYLPVHLQGFEPPGYERTELSLSPEPVPSECSSHSASCSPEWGSALEFGPNPGDHLLPADPADAHNLHSLTSIVDSITMEDVSVAFPEETLPN